MFATYFILNDFNGLAVAITCLKHKCNFRLGSNSVLADLAQRLRLSEVERTSKPRKRTLPLEGRLSGVERSYQRRGPNRRS